MDFIETMAQTAKQGSFISEGIEGLDDYLVTLNALRQRQLEWS